MREIVTRASSLRIPPIRWCHTILAATSIASLVLIACGGSDGAKIRTVGVQDSTSVSQSEYNSTNQPQVARAEHSSVAKSAPGAAVESVPAATLTFGAPITVSDNFLAHLMDVGPHDAWSRGNGNTIEDVALDNLGHTHSFSLPVPDPGGMVLGQGAFAAGKLWVAIALNVGSLPAYEIWAIDPSTDQVEARVPVGDEQIYEMNSDTSNVWLLLYDSPTDPQLANRQELGPRAVRIDAQGAAVADRWELAPLIPPASLSASNGGALVANESQLIRLTGGSKATDRRDLHCYEKVETACSRLDAVHGAPWNLRATSAGVWATMQGEGNTGLSLVRFDANTLAAIDVISIPSDDLHGCGCLAQTQGILWTVGNFFSDSPGHEPYSEIMRFDARTGQALDRTRLSADSTSSNPTLTKWGLFQSAPDRIWLVKRNDADRSVSLLPISY